MRKVSLKYWTHFSVMFKPRQFPVENSRLDARIGWTGRRDFLIRTYVSATVKNLGTCLRRGAKMSHRIRKRQTASNELLLFLVVNLKRVFVYCVSRNRKKSSCLKCSHTNKFHRFVTPLIAGTLSFSDTRASCPLSVAMQRNCLAKPPCPSMRTQPNTISIDAIHILTRRWRVAAINRSVSRAHIAQ